MKLWVDAQLSPAFARWLREALAIEAIAVRELGFRDAQDRKIFMAARQAGAVVMTKDVDFLHLLERLGPPPQVIWVTCGNTSNIRLRQILATAWPAAEALLARGEPLVEISERDTPTVP
jgi:predicted nuclease of predicted toxin-antitoxin system